MNKAFVNPTQEKIVGDSKVEERKKKIIASDPSKTAQQVDTELAKQIAEKPILLKDNGKSRILLGIEADPKLTATQKDVTFKIIDDGVEIAVVSKNTLIQACQANREPDRLKGITYLVPLFSHSVVFDYQYQNQLTTLGDISGIHFYFSK